MVFLDNERFLPRQGELDCWPKHRHREKIQVQLENTLKDDMFAQEGKTMEYVYPTLFGQNTITSPDLPD